MFGTFLFSSFQISYFLVSCLSLDPFLKGDISNWIKREILKNTVLVNKFNCEKSKTLKTIFVLKYCLSASMMRGQT